MRIFITNAAKVALASAAFLFAAAPKAGAQVKIGIRVAPIVTYSRVQDQLSSDLGTGYDIKYGSREGTMNFSGGLIMDYFFASNYAINTGVYYTVKRASVDGGDLLGYVNWNLQEVQVPISIKLFTNEIAPDLRLYFQLGATLDLIVAQKLKDYHPGQADLPTPEGKPFRPFDIGILGGFGAEYRIAETTTLFGGFSYNRGFVNINSQYGAFSESRDVNQAKLAQYGAQGPGNSIDRYRVLLDAVSLDLGVKF